MKRLLAVLALLTIPALSLAADIDCDADSDNQMDLSCGGTNADTAANARTSLGVPATAATLVGSCTVGPCLDGTSDGGDLIKLYGSLGFWTSLQAGAATANVHWRLPLANPGAGTTRLINSDEYGNMGLVDPASFLTPTGSASSLTVTASGFNGNLTAADDTVQELADAVDNLVLGGAASISDTAYDATTWNAVVDVAPSKNAVRDAIEALPSLTIQTSAITTGATNILGSDYGLIADTDGDGLPNKVDLTAAGIVQTDANGVVSSSNALPAGTSLPQGTGPTVDAAGETAVDTTSDQFVFYGASKRVLSHKFQENFAIKTPVDADDFFLFKAQQAITITDIHVITIAGTSIAVDIQECDSAGANCATVDAAITAVTTGAEDDGAFTNGTIDAGDWVKVVLAAPSGTVNYLTGSIYYTITAD